jgi:outer membrane protein OmpA-like peptidoglycan-associated protein
VSVLRALFAAALLGAAAVAAAATKLPDYLTLPPQVQPQNDDAVTFEAYGEAEFGVQGSDAPAVERGKHWNAALVFGGVPEETEDNDLWARIKPALVKGGWTIVAEFDVNPYSATFRYQKNGKDAWGTLTLFNPGDLRMDLVEVGTSATKLALKAPASKPEKIDPDHGDFPYLSPLPGSRLTASGADASPMAVTLEGSEDVQIVAPSSMHKDYTVSGVSNVQFVDVYRDALTTAGWKVLLQSQGLHQGDAVILAHYDRNGRNLWAYLHHGGEEYTMQVGDASVIDLGAQLARDCHAALYGVLFDFNKSTLKPESEAALTQARDALKAHPGLEIEVQGHTDNVGGDDYNRKLSEARAASVMQWLIAHGVSAAQLTSKGYGRSKPVASNDSDQGRARNRRVELACRK